MKRFFVFTTLLTMMLGTLFSGCTPSGGAKPNLDPSQPVTVEVWHYYNGPQKTAFDAMVSEFNETVGFKEGIIVESFSMGNVTALSEKVLAAAQGAVGAQPLPAIFATYADTAFQVDQLGKLAALDPFFTEEELSAYRPEFIAEGRFSTDGTLKIFPVAKSVELMMVNLTDWNTFAEQSGAELSDLSTIEGVVDISRRYYEWSGKACFGRDAMANYIIIGSHQLGLELFNVSGDTVSLGMDQDVFRTLWDNYYVPLINGWFSANGRFRSDEAHIGDIIAFVGSSSATAYFPSEVKSDTQQYVIDSAILPAPHFAEGQTYAIQQGAGMSIVKADPIQEYASALFLKWFAEPTRNISFSTASGGYLPVTNEALNLEKITAALNQTVTDPQLLSRMSQTFEAALTQLSENTMYTPRPFDGNIAVRAILEQSMSDWAKQDRASVLALINQGVSQSEAVARYDTDENFEHWLTQFKDELTQVIG